MARFVVPVVVLVALVGGYVVGQQPNNLTPPAVQDQLEPLKGDPGERVEDALLPDRPFFRKVEDGSQPASDGREFFRTIEPHANPVGRYVPFEVGMMLDTTNGTLYRQEGNPTRWKAIVTLGD